jgi:hypothetical protein
MRIVREFTRIFKHEHNVDGVAHVVDTKNFIHYFRAAVPPSLDGLRQVGRMMNGTFPDVLVTEEDLIGSDDRVVERSSAVGTRAMMGKTYRQKGGMK